MKLNTSTKLPGYNKVAEVCMSASIENQMKYGGEEGKKSRQ